MCRPARPHDCTRSERQYEGEFLQCNGLHPPETIHPPGQKGRPAGQRTECIGIGFRRGQQSGRRKFTHYKGIRGIPDQGCHLVQQLPPDPGRRTKQTIETGRRGNCPPLPHHGLRVGLQRPDGLERGNGNRTGRIHDPAKKGQQPALCRRPVRGTARELLAGQPHGDVCRTENQPLFRRH